MQRCCGYCSCKLKVSLCQKTSFVGSISQLLPSQEQERRTVVWMIPSPFLLKELLPRTHDPHQRHLSLPLVTIFNLAPTSTPISATHQHPRPHPTPSRLSSQGHRVRFLMQVSFAQPPKLLNRLGVSCLVTTCRTWHTRRL